MMYGGRRDWTDRETGFEYKIGAKYRVIREGGRLSGWTPMAPSAWSGWSQTLHVGDVIECRGFGPGWGSDPGYGVEWTSEVAREAHAGSCDFWPYEGGMWSYHPPAGFLEPVDVDEEMVPNS